MYISKRHFIKQAIQIPAFITKIKAIYPNSEQDPDFGKIINQFFQYKNIKPLNNESQELATILNELPSNWNEAKEYMKSQINSLAVTSQTDQEKKIKPISSEDIKQSLLNLGLKEEDLVKKEIRDWLYSRFIEKSKEEMHDIADSLITLKKYSDNKSNIINKANRDQAFVQQLSQNQISTDKISNMQELSVDDMEFILEKYDDNKETSINTTNVEIKPEEFVGKVGKWNIWLPSSQETSAKIAGYDEETKEPKTTWCTARTRGSNLFDHYISRGNTISFLFYIIKDNPSEDNDWLSLGFTGDSNKGLESIKPYYGGNGGLTVNKANKGLKEYDFDSILGENKEEIFSLTKKKIKDLGGKNPATEELKKYANNFELFKAELNKKNIEQKRDFCQIILQLNPNEEVQELAKIWVSYYADILDHKDNPNIAPFFNTILKMLLDKSPSYFLQKFQYEPWAQKYIPLTAKNAAEQNPDHFLENFGETSWGKKFIDIAAKKSAEYNPDNFIINHKGKDWAEKYIPLAAKEMAERKPANFINHYQYEPWAQEYIPLAIKNLAEKDPFDFLIKYKDNTFADNTLAKDYLPFAIQNAAKDSPSLYLIDYADEPWAKEAIPLAAKKWAEDSPYDFLNDFSSEPWAQEFIPIAAKKEAEENPSIFFQDYKEKPWAQEYFPLAGRSMVNKYPQKLLMLYSNEPWAQEPREELGGKSFLDIAREKMKLASLIKSLNILGFNKEASLIKKIILY